MRSKRFLSLLLCLVLAASLFPLGSAIARAEDDLKICIDGWTDSAGNEGAVTDVVVNGISLPQNGGSITLTPGSFCSVQITLAEDYALTAVDGAMLRWGSRASGSTDIGSSSSPDSIQAPSAEWAERNPEDLTLYLLFATEKKNPDTPPADDAIRQLSITVKPLLCGSEVEFDEENFTYSFSPEMSFQPEELKDKTRFVWLKEDQDGLLKAKPLEEGFKVVGEESYLLGLQIAPNGYPADLSSGSWIPVDKLDIEHSGSDALGRAFDPDALTISLDGASLKAHQLIGSGDTAFLLCVLEIEAEHDPADPVKENVVAPLCTQDGSHDEVVYCKGCEKELSRETVTDPQIGHDWGDWIVTKEPTIDEPGERTRTCRHNIKHKETEEIPMLESCTVTFETNGGSAIDPVRVEKGKSIEEPEEPTKDKATFDCWCSDEDLTTEYDFSTPVTQDITLYAKWIDKNPIKYTVVSGGGSIWGKGGVREVQIVVKRNVDDKNCFSHFQSVSIDGAELVKDTDYTASAGSTIINLKPVALNKLNSGNHTVIIQFDDGKAVTGLIIKVGTGGGGGRGGANSPDTGDENMTVWTIVLAASALGVAGGIIYIVQKSKKKK